VLDGKIKAWLYDNLGSRVDYDAPGRWCKTMAYSADGTRSIFTTIAPCNLLDIAASLNYTFYFFDALCSYVLIVTMNVYYRLFSCGTSKDGESSIVEWNESEGAVKRTYQGFRKRPMGVVQFDTTKNLFLAAGDDFSIKFWDMVNIQLLTTVDADGGLPVSSLFYCKLKSLFIEISVANSFLGYL